MAILDTFHILVSTDATKAAQETEKLNNSLNKTSKVGDKVSSSMGRLRRRFVGLASAAIYAGATLKFLSSSTEYAANLGSTSKALGESVENFDAWGKAVKDSGGTQEGFESSLKSIKDRLIETGRGSQSAMPYLLRLSSIFEKVGKSRALMIGKDAHLDIGMITFLQQGRRAIEEQIRKQKELGVVTQEDADKASKFQSAVSGVNSAFKLLGVTISSALSGSFSEKLDWIKEKLSTFTKFLKRHEKLITGFFMAVSVAVGVVAVAMGLLTSPLVLITGGILLLSAAFALAYDDIMTFLEGGDSLYGRIIKQYPVIHKMVKATGQFFKQFGQGLVETFEVVSDAIDSLILSFKYMFEWINKSIDAISKGWSKLKSLLGKDNKIEGNLNISKTIENGKKTLELIGSNPINAQTSNSIINKTSGVNKNTSVNIGDVTIETQASDSEQIAKSFKDNLREQINQTFNNYSDGVVA